MTNVEFLEDAINRSGKKKEFLAERCGLTRQGFWLKCIGRSDFTAPEIKILCDELGIDDLNEREAIFFASKV